VHYAAFDVAAYFGALVFLLSGAPGVLARPEQARGCRAMTPGTPQIARIPFWLAKCVGALPRTSFRFTLER